jgi:hypothetical protein
MNGNPEMTTGEVVALALGLSCGGLFVGAMVIAALVAAARGLDIKYFESLRETEPTRFRRLVMVGRFNCFLVFLGSIGLVLVSAYFVISPEQGPAVLRIPGAVGILLCAFAFGWLSWHWLTWAWRTNL